MALFPAIRIEGGLLGPDVLEQLLTGDLAGQRAGDFGLEARRNLTDEIAAVFADARAIWTVFQHRLQRLAVDDLATTVTRDAWVIPLLGLLGYEPRYNARAFEVDGLTFAISHRAGEAEDSPPVHIVGARQELGRVPAVGRPRLAPHSLMQEYVNRTEHIWGIVTNGIVLRLLRDCTFVRRQAYVEFDLQGMIEENRFQDFAALYRLLHRSRMPQGQADAGECLLEQYYAHSVEQGGRVREHLRDGVEECITRLANGFLSHPANDDLRRRVSPACTGNERISAANLYRQVLRIVYRFLFLLVSEDRGLLGKEPLYREHYSIGRLRRLVDQRSAYTDDNDLWQGLRLLWRVLIIDRLQAAFNNRPTAAVLGLPVLNGDLFAPQDLDACTICNRDLLDAFWRLAWYQEGRNSPPRRVNYAALDVEELGSVYESLLEFHPAIEYTSARPAFQLLTGSERKSTGSYYTPPQLVAELVHSALEPVMRERQAARPKENEKAILTLRVCDPACGSGHFLLAAARCLGKELARIRTGEDEPAPDRVREAIRDVISHCIYGVDKNPLAVDLCRVALWLESNTGDKPLTFLDHRIRCGDSLIGVFDLEVLKDGIPDKAFEPLEGDDKPAARAFARRNREERKHGEDLFTGGFDEFRAELTRHSHEIDVIADDSSEAIRRKRLLFDQGHSSVEWQRQVYACDLWTAAFFQQFTAGSDAITSATLAAHLAGRQISAQLIGRAVEISGRQCFFHWPLQFPEVFADGGFDVVLANPPYGAEISKEEKHFLAEAHHHVTSADNSAAYFVSVAGHLVGPTGRVGYVLPKSVTYSHAWVSTRDYLSVLLSVIDVGQAWRSVLLEQVLVTFAHSFQTRAAPLRLGRFLNGTTASIRTVDNLLIKRLGIIPTGLNEDDHLLLAVVSGECSSTLASICSTQRGTGIQRFLRGSGDMPVLAGKDIADFIRPVCPHYVNLSEIPANKLRITSPPQAVFQNIVAHVTQPNDHLRLIGTVVDSAFACVDTVNLISIVEPSMSPGMLCGLLMSDLVNWFVYTCIYNRAVRTMHFDGYFLAKIPVPQIASLAALGDSAKTLQDDPGSECAWRRLNDVVFDAYRIPAALRAYLAEMHNPRWHSLRRRIDGRPQRERR